MQAVRIDESQAEGAPVPLSIVQYVLRTKSFVMLDDAYQSGSFTFDPYIARNNTKSVLCLPVLGQNKMVAVVYLENNLMPGLFVALLPCIKFANVGNRHFHQGKVRGHANGQHTSSY